MFLKDGQLQCNISLNGEELKVVKEIIYTVYGIKDCSGIAEDLWRVMQGRRTGVALKAMKNENLNAEWVRNFHVGVLPLILMYGCETLVLLGPKK